ncbi:CARDB domain-containing protein [Halococcus salifodinae]|nr:CARDB domain-containing protein [Halococcus salifodinae]
MTGPSEVGQGEEFTATATITNTGDEEGTQTIYPFLSEASAVSQYDLSEVGTQEMLANLRPQATPQEVTLDGGESTTVSFTYEVAADKEPGNYSYVASSLQEIASHSLTITAANGSGQASASSAPTLDNRADGLEQQRSVRGVAVIAG